jgi:predicted ATPase
MLSYFSRRYDRKGLYFLDEPEAALSPASQLAFLQVLRAFAESGQAQFIVATHSPILLALPNAQIYSFDGSKIEEVAYEDTEHYKVYKAFFADPRAFLDVQDSETTELSQSQEIHDADRVPAKEGAEMPTAPRRAAVSVR